MKRTQTTACILKSWISMQYYERFNYLSWHRMDGKVSKMELWWCSIPSAKYHRVKNVTCRCGKVLVICTSINYWCTELPKLLQNINYIVSNISFGYMYQNYSCKTIEYIDKKIWNKYVEYVWNDRQRCTFLSLTVLEFWYSFSVSLQAIDTTQEICLLLVCNIGCIFLLLPTLIKLPSLCYSDEMSQATWAI